MLVVAWLVLLAAGYLYGSVSFALIITRWRSGQDIRTIGNRNAGAANVRRTVGFWWGFLVFFLDVSKSLLPMYLTSRILASVGGAAGFAAVFSVGVAAFAGHCRPIYYGFRGGRGIATSLGAYGWFVPVELISAMLLGAALVLLVVRNVKHRLGPYTPMAIVALTPLFALLSTLFLNVRPIWWLPIGFHPWYVLVGVFLFSLTIVAMHSAFVRARIRELRAPRSEESAFD